MISLLSAKEASMLHTPSHMTHHSNFLCVIIIHITYITKRKQRIHLVGGVEKREDRKWRKDRKYLFSSHMCLVGRMENLRDGK